MILAWSLLLAISGPASPAPPVVLRPAPKRRASAATDGSSYVPHSDLRDPFARTDTTTGAETGAGASAGPRASPRTARATGLKDPFGAQPPERERAQAQRASSTLEPAPRRALVDPFAVTPSGRPPPRLSEELKDPFRGLEPSVPKTTSGSQPPVQRACPSGRAVSGDGCAPPSPVAGPRSS